jgi:hypothetical protein
MTIFGDGRFQNKDIAEWDESEVPTTPQCIYKSQERKRETPRYDAVAEAVVPRLAVIEGTEALGTGLNIRQLRLKLWLELRAD